MSFNLNSCLKHFVQLALLTAATLFSSYSLALGLGEIQVTSYFGSPFNATLALTGWTEADGENIEVRLSSVDEYGITGLVYPDDIEFRFKVFHATGHSPFVRIVTVRPVNTLFLNLLIEVSSATGQHSKAFVVLLDPPSAPDYQDAALAADRIEGSTHSELQPVRPSVTRNTDSGIKTGLAAASPDNKTHSPSVSGARKAAAKTDGRVQHGVKSRGNLTVSKSPAAAKADQHRRLKEDQDRLQEQLISQEKSLDELNAQIADMQSIINTLHGRLAGQGVAAVSGVSAGIVAVMPEKSHIVASSELSPSVLVKLWMPILGILAMFTAAYIVWYVRRKPTHSAGPSEQVFESAPVDLPHQTGGAISVDTDYQETYDIFLAEPIKQVDLPVVPKLQEVAVDEHTGEDKSDDSPSAEDTPMSAFELNDLHAMIEEAELYAMHGHPFKAIEILNDIILEHPKNVEVWLLLLSIFCNHENVEQFEMLARRFLDTVSDRSAWRRVQEAGRSIDPGNGLYFDPKNKIPVADSVIRLRGQRLLGEILLDINAISVTALESCLERFDHLRDGSFGDYLIACGLINSQQLEEALRIQGLDSADTIPVMDSSPTGQHAQFMPKKPRMIGDVLIQMGALNEDELQHVLVDFDPKLHGRCGSYLVSCGVITNKQLHQAVLQQLRGAMSVDLQVAEDQDDVIDLDSPLEFTTR